MLIGVVLWGKLLRIIVAVEKRSWLRAAFAGVKKYDTTGVSTVAPSEAPLLAAGLGAMSSSSSRL
jgi:hypothetical protein